MFDYGFPSHWSTLKKLIWLKASALSGAVYATVTGAIASFTTLRAAPLKELLVNIDPVQSGSGDPSPDNVRPISGWSEAKVTRTGKNLFDIHDFWVNGSDYTGANTVRHIGLRVKPGKYTISTDVINNTNANVASVFATVGANYVPGVASGTAGVFLNRPRTLNVTENSLLWIYIRTVDSSYLAWNEQTFSPYYIQVELGEADTAYEPYSGTTVTIDLDGTIYGGTLDVLTGVLTVDKVAVTIDGDTLKANEINSFPPNARTKTNYPTGLTGKYNSTSTFCLSDKLKPNYSQVIGNPANATELCVYPHSSGIMVTFPASTGVTTKALADAWFAENTPMVCYELATPLTVQLTPAQLSTLAGENNVWADAGNVTVEYRSN